MLSVGGQTVRRVLLHCAGSGRWQDSSCATSQAEAVGCNVPKPDQDPVHQVGCILLDMTSQCTCSCWTRETQRFQQVMWQSAANWGGFFAMHVQDATSCMLSTASAAHAPLLA